MIVFGSCDSTSTSTLTTTSLTPESSAKMGDLEDLNRTLYDIGAQDLLDVWDAMETEVRISIHLLKSLTKIVTTRIYQYSFSMKTKYSNVLHCKTLCRNRFSS